MIWDLGRRLVVAAMLVGIVAVVPREGTLEVSSQDPTPAIQTSSAANPLAGRPWGVYRGGQDMSWAPYAAAKGEERALLAKISQRPKAQWFGAWIPNHQIADRVRSYIDNATGGDPDVLVQMTLFRMVPWEHAACDRLPTKAEVASYKDYIRRFSAAVGDTHAAIVLQPDGPFAVCAPGGSRIYSRLISWTAEVLSRRPHVTTYIEVGSSDWNHHDPANAVKLLVRGGIQHVRGFHLNVTHFESAAIQVAFGAKVVAALARAGYPGKHFTVDTAQNGRPFDWPWFQAHHPGKFFDNAPTCRTRKQTHCVTLGIPPTTDVANARWGMTPAVRRLARAHVDAFLWAGRPWLTNQAAPFDRRRALAIARTTPY